ncbi:MAG TPA: hypothetical protein VHO06_01890 [Polyangia bacterium]|nr:hypothetical protein [Polyangia bacterium]
MEREERAIESKKKEALLLRDYVEAKEEKLREVRRQWAAAFHAHHLSNVRWFKMRTTPRPPTDIIRKFIDRTIETQDDLHLATSNLLLVEPDQFFRILYQFFLSQAVRGLKGDESDNEIEGVNPSLERVQSLHTGFIIALEALSGVRSKGAAFAALKKHLLRALPEDDHDGMRRLFVLMEKKITEAADVASSAAGSPAEPRTT